jgi:hypothetical protein
MRSTFGTTRAGLSIARHQSPVCTIGRHDERRERNIASDFVEAMNREWSFARSDTGEFTGRRFSGPDGSEVAKTPAGCIAIEGRHDRLSQRVDVATGSVVPYERPEAELEAEQRAQRRQQARQRIDELERAQHRPLRELAIDPDNAEAKRRLDEPSARSRGCERCCCATKAMMSLLERLVVALRDH